MKVELSLRRVVEIYSAIERLSPHVKSVKVAYSLARNRARLRDEIEPIRSIQPPKEFMEYEQRRHAAAQAHAIKGPDGRPVQDGGQYVVEDPVEFQNTIGALRKEYSAAIEEYEAQQKEIDTLLDKDVKVEFYRIPASLVESDNAFADDTPSLAMLLEPLIGYVIDES